jgi:hypothetical protein
MLQKTSHRNNDAAYQQEMNQVIAILSRLKKAKNWNSKKGVGNNGLLSIE